jgi:hypothetical protein
MTKTERLRVYIKQWESAANLLRGPVTVGADERLAAYLLGRDTLAELPELPEAVRVLDLRFAEALAAASAEWWRRITRITMRSGIYPTPWWQSILRMAVEEPAALQRAG